MKQSFVLLLSIVVLSVQVFAQCNGFVELCDRKYDQVSYLTTHNAFNAGDEGFQLPNQNQGLTGQLNGGVRAFMLDVYDQGGVPTVYHGFSLLGTAPLTDNLAEIKTFLDANPNEVVTIIFESYVDANMMETAFTSVGLIPYLHTQTLGNAWPTLQQMINAGNRLVVFSDSDDASPRQGWYHYMWDFAVETHYSNNAPTDFSCEFNRGDSINDLFILNHFITDATLGVGVSAQSEIVNAYDFFYPRAVGCWSEKQKFPNFPTVDFYELGETKRVIDSLNLDPSFVSIDHFNSPTYTLYTKGNGQFSIKFNSATLKGTANVYSIMGQLLGESIDLHNGTLAIDLRSEPRGTYLIRITPENGKQESIVLLN